MSKFRQRPSQRREPKPTASWLVLGLTTARLVAHGQRTTHIAPVKPRDHRKKYLAGQRLSVRAFVGGVTECHVVVSDAQRIQLGQVDYGLVRELGYVRLDDFQVTWVEEHETTWRAGETVPEGDLLERFQRRHAHREVWVVRFALDRTDSGGLPAAKSEEGYTDSPARAMREEMPAVRGVDWDHFIGGPSRDREARRQRMLATDWAALDTTQRIAYARHAANTKGLDMRSEFRLYDRLVRLERAGEALRQLELIESRVFPQRRAA